MQKKPTKPNIPLLFFSTFPRYEFKKGDSILRPDDTPQRVYFLEAGVVKMYAISQKGDEVILNTYKSGSFFPMAWAITNTPNKYYHDALSDVTVFGAPREKVVEFLKSEPQVMYDLLARIYTGLDGFYEKMSRIMSGSAYSCVITEILIRAKRFGQENTDQNITVSLTEKDIAFSAGLTRETVSREMRVLKQKGLVQYEKNILTISHLSSLEKELETV